MPGLRELAESDLEHILEDGVHGFGWEITLTAPDGYAGTGPFTGYSNDIAQLVDPDTGQAVSGRLAGAVLRISSIMAQGFTGLPRGIEDSSQKPWLVTFNDINGNPFTFKVTEGNPDRAIGVVALVVEFYQ